MVQIISCSVRGSRLLLEDQNTDCTLIPNPINMRDWVSYTQFQQNSLTSGHVFATVPRDNLHAGSPVLNNWPLRHPLLYGPAGINCFYVLEASQASFALLGQPLPISQCKANQRLSLCARGQQGRSHSARQTKAFLFVQEVINTSLAVLCKPMPFSQC